MANATKLLIAASSSIPEAVVRKKLPLISDNFAGQITFLEGNIGLRNYLRELHPKAEAAAAKNPASFRKLVAAHDHLVLLWDGEDLTRLLFEGRLAKKKIKLITIPITKVVNKKLTSDYDVYIGRGTPWGNPFTIGHGDGPDRAEVINRYREHFQEKINTDPNFKKGILAMKGLRLACFCKPEACHGDVIAEYLDQLPEKNQEEESNE